MSPDTKDQIEAKLFAIPTTVIVVADLTLTIRKLTVKARQDWIDAGTTVKDAKGNMVGGKDTDSIPVLLAYAVVDEDGKPLWTTAEADKLVEADARKAEGIAGAVLAFSGLNRPLNEIIKSQLEKLDNGESTVEATMRFFRGLGS
jgi:hypothetical protein